MQVSHLQEAVRQNESASYYLEAGAAACPPESEAAAHLDQARQHLAGTDNVVKIALDVYAALWEHGRAAPAVLDLQNQQSRTYNPTPGRYTVAAQTKSFLSRKNSLPTRATTSPQELSPTNHLTVVTALQVGLPKVAIVAPTLPLQHLPTTGR
jgi:hypothetical protein